MSGENGPEFIPPVESVKPIESKSDFVYKDIKFGEFFNVSDLSEDEKNKIKADQEKLIKSGVCDVFLQLKDSGEVKGSEEPVYKTKELPQTKLEKLFGKHNTTQEKIADYQPAEIKWDYGCIDKKTRVVMKFGDFMGVGGTTSGRFYDEYDLFKKITAEVDANNNLLINKHEVEGDLLDAVRQEVKTTKPVRY